MRNMRGSEFRAKRSLWWRVAASAALVISLAGCNNAEDEGIIRISGNIELTEVKVAFKISGKMTERLVDEGERVEAGQLIARLDREQLLRQKEQGLERRLVLFSVPDGAPLLLHDEPIYRNDTLVGATTSGNRSFRVGGSLCLALLENVPASYREYLA